MISLLKDEESLLLPDGFCVGANGVRPNTCPDPLREKYYKIPSPAGRGQGKGKIPSPSVRMGDDRIDISLKS
jgi:hypothetical protein